MAARRFCRFRPGTRPPSAGTSEVPDDGFCLSAFLVVESATRRGDVLLGRIDPEGPWSEAGGLSGERLRRWPDRWMLPASHLLLFESPGDAARRISAELLGRPIDEPGRPQVFSETYGRGAEGGDPHWDLQFVYRFSWPDPAPAAGPLWRELAFRPVRTMVASEFARDHQDVLALVGLRDP